MGISEVKEEELKNLAIVAEYMHGGEYLSDAHKVTRSFKVMLDYFDTNQGFGSNLSYLLTPDLQGAYNKIAPHLKADVSNLNEPELQKLLDGYMPSKNTGVIHNTPDLLMALLPADGQLKLDDVTKANIYKFLVEETVEENDEKKQKIHAIERAVEDKDSAFINQKFDAVVDVLFGSKENHQMALEKMANHPGLHCTNCEVGQKMKSIEAVDPKDLKKDLDNGQNIKIK